MASQTKLELDVDVGSRETMAMAPWPVSIVVEVFEGDGRDKTDPLPPRGSLLMQASSFLA